MKHVAVVGCGARAAGLLRNFHQFGMDARVTAVMDVSEENARRQLRENGFDLDGITFCDDLDTLLSRAQVDGVVVATRCNTHADLAARVMRYGLPLFLEKPVAVSMEQLDRLAEAYRSHPVPTLVSFPLRASYQCRLVKRILDSGELGELSHVEACNYVPYGRVYFKGWYRDESVTGGLFLQKATHDLDYLQYLLGEPRPVAVCAMESKRIFRGDQPAGLRCDDCPRFRTCPESPFVLKTQFNGESSESNRMCSFACDTGNHDSGSVLVRYENGMHAVYTQDFVARKQAARRGARIVGYRATLEFDWQTQEIRVYSHREKRVDEYRLDYSELVHWGGDKVLCENFIEVMGGGESLAPLSTGLLSARLCLCARESARTDRFVFVEL